MQQPTKHTATDNLLHPQNASRFGALLLIWSFTPLAVVVSVQEVSSLWAFCLRFLCAAPLAHLLLSALGQKLPVSSEAIKSYLAGALGIFVAMMLTYLAAASLPSSIISMIFGLSPLVSGLIGLVIYHKQLHTLQWFGIGFGLVGLALALGLFSHSLQASGLSIALVLGAMLLSVVSLYVVNHIQTEAHLRMPTRFRRPRFANAMTLVRLNLVFDHPLNQALNQALKQGARKSGVLQGVHHVKNSLRKITNHTPDITPRAAPTKSTTEATNEATAETVKITPPEAGADQSAASLTPLMQTVGTLWVSFFGVLTLLPFIWGSAPSTLPSTRGLVAIGFLVVFASMLAFVVLYELNQRISPTATSLVTIITPILATLWGAWLNAEPVNQSLLWGLGCIVVGLSVFVWGGERGRS